MRVLHLEVLEDAEVLCLRIAESGVSLMRPCLCMAQRPRCVLLGDVISG